MKQRIITAIIMAIVLIPLFILGGWFTNILFAILAYVGTYELISLRSKKSNLPKISKFILPLFSSMIVIISALYGTEDVIYVLLVQLMLLLLLPIFNKRYTFNDVLMFIFGIIYCGVMFSIIANLRNIEIPSFESYKPEFTIYPEGLVLLTYLLITTMFTDIFPKSLTSYSLLIFDAIKSPSCPAMLNTMLIAKNINININGLFG